VTGSPVATSTLSLRVPNPILKTFVSISYLNLRASPDLNLEFFYFISNLIAVFF
jgi:hypothetical protein